MPIKKSFFAKKWYYRLAKISYLALPFIVEANSYFSGRLTANNISTKIVAIVIEWLLYYVVVYILWRVLMYIAFGGIEDDIKIKKLVSQPAAPKQAIRPAPAAPQLPAKPAGASFAVVFFIVLIIVAVIGIAIYQSEQTNSNTNSGGGGGGGGGTTHAYCYPGNTYNYSSGKCCPNATPHYYNGSHGMYQVGCYASCPYIGDCSEKTTRY